MLQEIIPNTLEDTILFYLKDQEIVGEDYTDGIYAAKDEIAVNEVRAILRELMLKVDKRIACRDRYDNMKQWHHQYPLFNMTDFIPNFCIDDEMLKKLAFRETLFISEVDTTLTSEEVEPKAAGGLCLDIEIVEGHQPAAREQPIDAEMDMEVFQILQKIKTVMDKNQPIVESEMEKEVQLKLKEYEEFLKIEMRNNVKKFLVHFSSQFEVDGCNAGSNITAWVDRYLHTLEEKRTEFIVQPSGLNEKAVYVAIQNQKYYARHTSVVDDLDVKKYYPFYITKYLVLEGANFLLLRYLAITKYVGSFELSTMYINGDMCRNIYECIGPREGEVNGKTMDVCKIFRYVIEESGIEHHGITVLTTFGRIITHEWESCNFILNMNPLLHVDDETPCEYERLVMSKTWQDDMQLMSKYLDCKTMAERKMKTYMTDHPEVKEIIADFVQNVLLLKPENIMAFTMDYFQSLYPCSTPRMTYLEERNNVMEKVDFS